ncbi:MAG: methyl-accepting chemotaxis protein, partial [Magnetococcales bacterium]|nr:methyl-accepting chemotaxis protein [Magnetococcales bacterium]
LIPLLEKYGQTFQTIATEMEQRGLDYDSGQQKRFRDAAHALEDAFLVHDVEDVQAGLEHLLRLTMTALLSHEEAHRQQVTTASQLVQQLIKEKKENSSLVVDMLAGLTLFQREMTNDPDSVQKIAQLWHHPAYTTLLELIHKVNQQAIPGSHNLYLTMRRMEKDYLLRQDGQYLNGVRQQGLLLTGLIEASSLSQSEKAHLTSHLATYQDAMDQLATLDASIQQNMDSMRQTVRQTEPLALRIVTIAEELASATALETREFAEKSARFIFVICLATILLCGMLSFFMVRTIVGSISQLWQFSHEVAHGNLEATISLDSKDEIGQLSLVMVEMVNRMRAMRLIADRMVMIMTLAARGAIPDQLDAQLHGDFQKMGTALNDMIHRLKELRLIADRVDRISHGEIPAKLEGTYQGDFKRMADAINTIIDKLQEMGGLSPQERFSQEG